MKKPPRRAFLAKNMKKFTLSYPNLPFGVVTKCLFYIKLKARKQKAAYLKETR